MYVINCSSCGQSDKSPFARVGAVMTCPSCKATVQLRPEDVKRQFKLRNELDDDLFRVPQVQRAEEPAAAVAATAVAVADVVEPTPVHEIHEDHAELAAEAERRADAAKRRKPKAQAIVKPGMSAGEIAQHLASKRHKQTAAVLVGVAAVAIVVIIVIISAASKNGTKDGTKDGAADLAVKDTTANGDGGKKDGSVMPVPPVTDGTKDKTVVSKDRATTPVTPKDRDKPAPPVIVRVNAVQLGIDEWQHVNEAYQASTGDGSIVLVNDSSEKQASGDQVFKADLVSENIASALVSVSLVNDEDRVYARFERPFFLLESRKARQVKLVIPKELIGATTGIHWSVQAIDAHVKNPTLLSDPLAEVIKNDAKPVIKIEAYNATDRSLKDAAFVIQASEADGQLVGQWRLRFPNEVGAKSWVKFEAELPAAIPKSAASWRVLGAGIATGEAVLPPPPDPTPERNPEIIPRRGRGLFDF